MIVISGALAVVAFVLLIAGLVQSGLGLVYASIAVSLVSAVFLGVGAYQRRGEEVGLPAAAGGVEPLAEDEVTRVVPVAPVAPADEPAFAFATADGGDAAGGGDGASVLVVPGRPRYHVAGCRYLVGKEGEERSLAEARNEGYTACGICRPDENLGTAALTPAFVGGSDDDVDVLAAPRARSRSRSTAKKTAAKRAGTTKKSAAPRKKTAAKSTARKTSTTKKSTAKKATKTTAKSTSRSTFRSTAKSTAKSAAKRSTAKKTAAKSTKKSTAKKATRRR